MKRPLQLRSRQIARGAVKPVDEDQVEVSGSQESKRDPSQNSQQPQREKGKGKARDHHLQKENENPNSSPSSASSSLPQTPLGEQAGAAVDPESQQSRISSATQPLPLDRSASSSASAGNGAEPIDPRDLKEESGQCHFCGQQGTLVFCDGCQRGFHYLCAKRTRDEIRSLPSWHCDQCAESRSSSSAPSSSSSSSSSSSRRRSRHHESGEAGPSGSRGRALENSDNEFEAPTTTPRPKRAKTTADTPPPATATTAETTAITPSTTEMTSPSGENPSPPTRASSIQVFNSTNITARASQHTGRARVQGPTSALSSFLAERGIQARGLNRWRPRVPAAGAPDGEASGEVNSSEDATGQPQRTQSELPSQTPTPTPPPSTFARRTRSTPEAGAGSSSDAPTTPGVRFEYVMEVRRRGGNKGKGKNGKDNDNDTEDADADFQESAPRATRKGKQKLQEDEKAKAKAKEKYLQERAQKKKEKQKGKEPGDSSSSSDSDDSGDEFEFKRVAICGSCGAQFPDGVLRCAKCSVNKRTPQASRKKDKKGSVGAILKELRGQVKPLQELCIEFICKNIDCVESFGDIASDVFEKICMLTCKMRLLTESTAHLFVGQNIDRLRLSDCADLTPAALTTIAKGCPKLKVLDLNRCGRLTDSILTDMSDNCPLVTELALGGAFLVTDEAFVYFMRSHPHLKSCRFENAPKAGVEVLKAAKYLTEATSLSFINCSFFADEYMEFFSPPAKLKELSVCNSTLLTDDGISTLLDKVLKAKIKLTTLNLSGCLQITDAIAKKIAVNFPQLTELSLEGSQVGDEGLIEIAGTCRSLKRVSLKRTCVGNDSLQALVVNCGKNLLSLDLNGLLEITEDSLVLVAENCPNLEELDLSWQRATNDLVIGKFLASAPNLSKISVWGCNKITECAFAPRAAEVGKTLKVFGQFIL